MSDLSSLLGTIMQHYGNSVPQNTNDVANVPHEQVVDHAQQLAQQAPPEQVNQAHQQAFQQLSPQQQTELYNQLVAAMKQNGINPQQAGVQENAPTPQNYAKATQYVSQKPDLFQNVFGKGGPLGSPVAKLALAGALAVAASKMSQARR
jgi:hypothetical protein